MGIEPPALSMEPSQQMGPGIGESREVWWLGVDRKWWTLVAVGGGTFVAAITSSVVNTVLSVIMRSYDIDFATAEWIIMMYLVVVSGLLLTFGRLGDIAGHKRVYVLGAIIFTVVSAMCAVAPSAPVLIGLRALQGVGAAMIIASAAAILTGAFPARQRGQALGLQGMMSYLGLMVGPVLGGFLTTELGWQSVFLMNLPIGAAVAFLAWTALADVKPHSSGERFDPAGALTFVVGLSALLLALSHGQEWGWSSPTVLGLVVVGAVLLAGFVHIERWVRYPMMDLSLFRRRLFTAATVSALMNYTCMNAVMFLVPFYLIQYRQFDPEYAGLLLSSQALIMAVVAPASGALSDRIGSRLLSTLGMGIATAAMVWMSMLGPEASNLQIIACLMLAGLGTGIFVSPNNSALMGSVPRQRHGVASAVLGNARNTGMVVGVALAGAAFAVALDAYGGTIGPSAGFLPAFRVAFLVVAACGAMGTVTSIVRGNPSPDVAGPAPSPVSAILPSPDRPQQV